MKKFGYSCTILNLGSRREVSGQIQTPVALPPEKQHAVLIVQEAGWVPEPDPPALPGS
jgi:hypothetical protein